MSKVRLRINDFKTPEDFLAKHQQSKVHGAFKYMTDKSHKENERIRTQRFQKIADSFKKSYQKKGIGKSKKIKGQTMPTQYALNNRNAKEWSNYQGMRGHESFKTFCLWSVT